ncbi:hypothetical protein ACFLXH_03285 [Chloroflexota bacterium]
MEFSIWPEAGADVVAGLMGDAGVAAGCDGLQLIEKRIKTEMTEMISNSFFNIVF